MELIDEVKAALRVKTTDEGITLEIQGLIDAAEADLKTSGLNPVRTEPLYHRAIILYCKANFGFDNPDAARLAQGYEALKQKMMGTEELRVV